METISVTKITDLVSQKMPEIRNDPSKITQIAKVYIEISDKLGQTNNKGRRVRRYGTGRVATGMELQRLLDKLSTKYLQHSKKCKYGERNLLCTCGLLDTMSRTKGVVRELTF